MSTFADLAFLIAFGDDILGPRLDDYARKAFFLATGFRLARDDEATIERLTELRRVAD